MIYDTTTSSFWFYNGSAWASVAGVKTIWSLSGNTGINPATHFIGTTDAQPLRLLINNIWAENFINNSVCFGLGAQDRANTGGQSYCHREHSLFAIRMKL
jgi:hypothetical protein